VKNINIVENMDKMEGKEAEKFVKDFGIDKMGEVVAGSGYFYYWQYS
jgi:hypothetical protein